MADLNAVKGVHLTQPVAADELAEPGFRLSVPRIGPGMIQARDFFIHDCDVFGTRPV
jgi:hypothetical protein